MTLLLAVPALALFVLILGGCSIRPEPAAHPGTAADPAPPPKAAERKGIQVRSIMEIGIHAGDTNGTPLDGHIEAVHLDDGSPVMEMGYGSPARGSIKAFGGDVAPGRGAARYFPPSDPGPDEIPVTLRATDGCSLNVSLPVSVGPRSSEKAASEPPSSGKVNAQENQPSPPHEQSGDSPGAADAVLTPKTGSETAVRSVRLTAPSTGARLTSRICSVEGAADGAAAGARVDLAVIDQAGTTWPQDNHPGVEQGGSFAGQVYVGEEQAGVGEWFSLVARVGGAVSSPVRVFRAS